MPTGQESAVRAQRETTDRTDSPRQTQRSGRRPAAAPAAPTAGILALQRAAGNAAVARAIEEQRDGDTVQRSTVHDVLRASGRPLDVPLRTEMEARLGTDFSDVRVHDDTAAQRSAAEIGARAYTSGSHVVIGQGGADRHTLAHELTHVIQQRQGPVSGTDNGSGLSVSDPSDHFERAAEANATRVMSGPAPTHSAAEARQAPGAPGAPGADTAAVQRVTEEEAYDELHSHPAGPSLRVRGPRRSKKAGMTPNQITDQATWDNLPPEYRNANKQRVEVSMDPQTLSEQQRAHHYSLGNAGRPMVGATGAVNVSPNEVLERMGRRDDGTKGYWTAQDRRDEKVTGRAADLLAQHTSRRPDQGEVNTTVGSARPATNGRPSAATEMAALLERYDGVILGGKHPDSPTWGFLIDNMAMLQAHDVKTIYVESLRDDSYQSLVDAYLEGPSPDLPQGLASFARKYDERYRLGDRGMHALLIAAKRFHMKVKGVDGRPARSIDGDNYMRMARMNTYAEQVVRREQERPDRGKYVMELGSAHAVLHEAPPAPVTSHGHQFDQRFPGLSDLLGVPPMELHEDSEAEGGLRLRQAAAHYTPPPPPNHP